MILKGRARKINGRRAGVIIETPEGNIELSYAAAQHFGLLQDIGGPLDYGADTLLVEDVVVAVTPYIEPEDPHGDMGYCPCCLVKEYIYLGGSLEGQVLKCSYCKLIRII